MRPTITPKTSALNHLKNSEIITAAEWKRIQAIRKQKFDDWN